MKPKDYQKTFKLNESKFFDRSALCSQLIEDFSTQLKVHPQINVRFFELEVSNLKIKWDRIFAGTQLNYDSAEAFWKYVYAVKIVPIRNIYFPDWKAAVHKYKMQYDKEYQDYIRRKKWREMDRQYYEEMEHEFWEHQKNYFENLLRNAVLGGSIQEAKEVLGIASEEDLTEGLIKSQYRSMAKLCHPDIGGDGKAFTALTSAKDLLLRSIV